MSNSGKISVIIPIHNEEKCIENNLHITKIAIGSLGYNYELIAVNDGSTDDTELILNGIKDKNIKVFNKPNNQGKGMAIKTGLKMVSEDTNYCVLLDADLQIHPSELITFFKQMEHWNADVVVGNKRHSYSNMEYTFMRKVLSKAYHLFIKALFDFPLSDTQCGLKLFKKSSLDLVMAKHLSKRFTFDLELLVAIRENNLRIADAPVKITKQIGTSSVGNVGTIWDIFCETMGVWWRLRKGWYKVR